MGLKKEFEDKKGESEVGNWRTDNTMPKRKRTNRQL